MNLLTNASPAEHEPEPEDQPDINPLFSSDVSGQAAENPAVARCCQAFTNAFEAILARDPTDEVFARFKAEQAYRKAIPPLVGANNIRDFIACTAYGLLIGAIQSADAARLLYAAQIAHGSRIISTKNRNRTLDGTSPGGSGRSEAPSKRIKQVLSTNCESINGKK
jgi:hypothetical protein